MAKAICPFGPGNVPAHALWLIWTARRRLDSISIAETAKPPNLVRAGIQLLLILILSLFVVAIEFVILLSNDGYFIWYSPIFGGISVI
ncbi:MAG TPA: hypothetical protein VKA87_09205 [Nitrososphaeraceae archaeon]|nr:hypothetical protein [Nitrososphaeraceae archaeon]